MADKNNILKTIILAVVFGLAAGLVGQIFSTAYITPEEIFVFGGGGNVRKNIAEEEDISETYRLLAPTVFEIYPQKQPSYNILDQLYLPKDRAALGFVLTSDGWLVTFGRALADNKNKFVVIMGDQKIFSPQKIFFDEATGVTFIKINAENLSVPKLGAYENLKTGDETIVPFGKQSFKLTKIANLAFEGAAEMKDLLKSSENFSEFILLDHKFAASELGAPLVNLDGEVIGVLSGEGNAVPIDFWRPAFLSILKNDKIKRPFLGIRYLDLSRLPGLTEAVTGGKTSGAMIWSAKNLQIQGVAKNSPAAKAGLRDGDIILKINAEEITFKNNLTKIVQEYDPGEEVELTILRNNKESNAKVTLGEKL